VSAPPDLPGWLRPLVDGADSVRPDHITAASVLDAGARASAVLVLFGESSAPGVTIPGDVLLIERAHTMRRHAGQMAFPGGALDPSDESPIDAALREAHEETALDVSGVVVVATLPLLVLPQRRPVPGAGFAVTPVLAWWRTPSEVRPADPAEVASVHRVPLDHLVDPANRLRVRHPSGYVGPAFRVGSLLVWGFTAGVLDRLLSVGGWERPWAFAAPEELPLDMLRLSS
jgi:8-oxo-dGTP pyrophosphatase MutT (NUDIX family)